MGNLDTTFIHSVNSIGSNEHSCLPVNAFTGNSSVYLLAVLKDYAPPNVKLLRLEVIRNEQDFESIIYLHYLIRATGAKHSLQWKVSHAVNKLPARVIIAKIGLLAN